MGPQSSCDVEYAPGSSGIPGVKSCSPCDGGPGESRREPALVEPAEKLLDARDHWDAVDALTRPTLTRLTRDNGHTERVTLPSLLDQLVEAMYGAESGGSHGVPSSRPPVDTAALSLLCRITDTVRDALRQRKLKRSFVLADDLRSLTSAVNTEGDPDRINDCVRLVRSWAGQIRATISNDPDRTWRLHGAACRVCASTTVPVFDADGGETRQPALIVHSDDGRIDKIECGFCGSVLTGPMMLDIVRNAERVSLDEARRITGEAS
jgi:hypothetical protein